MNRILYILALFILSLSGLAQKGSVSGSISDAETGEVIPFASVAVFAGGLDTRAYDSGGVQIFFQETEYTRFGPIAELSASYSFNMNGKSGKKKESTFGKEQF